MYIKLTEEEKKANKAFKKNMRLNRELDKREGAENLRDYVGKY